MTSVAAAAARLRRHDPLLGEALSLKLAEAGTRTADGGLVWKHDPLHLSMGPYPFRRDHAARFWRRITCPVLVVDGAQSIVNLPDPERAARRAELADHRHVTLAVKINQAANNGIILVQVAVDDGIDFVGADVRRL